MVNEQAIVGSRESAIELIQGLAKEWAPLAGLEIINNGTVTPITLNCRQFKMAPEGIPFWDLPGCSRPEVSFAVVIDILVGRPADEVKEYFRQQWVMAMLSLMELLNRPTSEANRKVAERQGGIQESIEELVADARGQQNRIRIEILCRGQSAKEAVKESVELMITADQQVKLCNILNLFRTDATTEVNLIDAEYYDRKKEASDA